MCGRFSLAKEMEELLQEFPFIREGFGDLVLKPRYNIAPSQQCPVIVNENGTIKLRTMLWGLVPHWAKDRNIGYKMINARSESVDEKPSFQKPFRSRRCLVPADGFYEWKRKGNGKKVPYRFTMKDKKPFAFAGLWDRWDKGNGPLNTFTIITCGSNKLMEPVHNRMPVILPEINREIWLNEKSNIGELRELLVPYDSSRMVMYRVSNIVNSWKNDSPECIDPVET